MSGELPPTRRASRVEGRRRRARRARRTVSGTVAAVAVLGVLTVASGALGDPGFVIPSPVAASPVPAPTETAAPSETSTPAPTVSEAPVEEAPAPVVSATYSPGAEGEAYTFANVDASGAPMTWCSGARVEVVQRPEGSPAGSDAILVEVLADLSARTGLDIVFGGQTDEDPDARTYAGAEPPPVILTWETAAEDPELADDVIGYAAPVSYTHSDGRSRYGSAEVVIDREDLPEVSPLLRLTLMHEFAHVVGLGHVEDEASVMWHGGETANADYEVPSEFSAGDDEGLALLAGDECPE